MAKFNLKELNPGVWFDYPDGGRVSIRSISLGQMNVIRKKTVKTEYEYKKTSKHGELQKFEIVKSDDDALMAEMWDYSIVDWDGFEDDNGLLPCNRENKIALMSGNPAFSAFVYARQGLLTDKFEKDKEEIEKNS
jgi:hypothetical protein